MDNKVIRIMVIGDSITQGKKSEAVQKQVYSSYLRDRLKRQNLNVELMNNGLGSENITQAFARFQTSVLDKHPDLVTLMYGTNDSFINPGSDTSTVSLPLFEETLNKMVMALQRNNIIPILVSPPPLWKFRNSNREPYISNGLNFSLQKYVLAIQRVALHQNITHVDIFHNWKLRSKSGQQLSRYYRDGIHPSYLGHLLIADQLFPAIRDKIERHHNPETELDWSKLLFRADHHALDFEDTKPRITPQIHDVILSKMPEDSDFSVRARLAVNPAGNCHISFNIGGNYIDFRRKENRIVLGGPSFGTHVVIPNDSMSFFDDRSFSFMFILKDDTGHFFANNKILYTSSFTTYPSGLIHFKTRSGNLIIKELSMNGDLIPAYSRTKNFSIPYLDISGETNRQIDIDEEANQYLGHPTTVLLDNQTTLFTVYPKGHGKGALVMKKSENAGKTWSGRLPVPKNWSTSKEVPTLYKMTDKRGKERIIMFSGLYPIRMAFSEDEGVSWTPLKKIGDFGGIVAMSDVIRLKNGNYMAFFHDDGRFIYKNGKRSNAFFVYSTLSSDGGLTWSYPKIVTYLKGAGLCEPGVIRSPNGKKIAMLLRENFRRYNSMIIYSGNEGQTWSKPRELPASLTGDRHQLTYSPDGRIVAVFRDMAQDSPTKGDFVAWVGTWNDLENGGEGAYRVRLLDNKDPWDCGYSGLEVLPDGTVVATTYGHWKKDESPYIKSVRFKLNELDKKAKELPEIKDVFINGKEGYPVYRIPAVITTKKGTILAFCEGRAGLNDHAENNIVLKRSMDEGATWEPLKVIEKNGKHSLNNPTVVQDESSGKILLMYQDYPEKYGERDVGSGYKGKNICRTFITTSTDEGTAWSVPKDITRSVKRKTIATSTASGPGIGIQIKKGPYAGRLVIPFNQGPYNHWKVYTVYSDDHGKKWRMGHIVPEGTKGLGNEVQVVELENGNLLLNSRSANGDYYRKKAISKDGGINWTPLVDDKALPEPQCQGSILRFNFQRVESPGRIIFANPASQTARYYGTIRISYDNGSKWPISKLVYNGPYAYSCLTRINQDSIGLLFEKDNYEKISFSIISLKWLEGK